MAVYGGTGKVVGEFDGGSNRGISNVIIFLVTASVGVDDGT